MVSLRLALPDVFRAERDPDKIKEADGAADPLGSGAQAFFDKLECPKTLIKFTAAEGAGDHCEMMNRSILNRRALDWLAKHGLSLTASIEMWDDQPTIWWRVTRRGGSGPEDTPDTAARGALVSWPRRGD